VSATPNSISRKALLTAGAGLAAMALDAGPFRLSALAAASSGGNAHLAALMAGNARFVAGNPRCVPATARRTELANGQAPFAAVLGCSDSRVPVETIFDHDPGDVFVVRVAGNFVTDTGLGSLEYSVAVLKSELIMVLGHSSCGAVKPKLTLAERTYRCGDDACGHVADRDANAAANLAAWGEHTLGLCPCVTQAGDRHPSGPSAGTPRHACGGWVSAAAVPVAAVPPGEAGTSRPRASAA